MKTALYLLPALLLAACSQQVAPPPLANEPQAQVKPREPEEWERYGMPSSQTYWDWLEALALDDLPRAREMFQSCKMPIEDFAERSFHENAARCFRWTLAYGYRPTPSDAYWDMMLTWPGCDWTAEEMDELRHVLIPLLESNRDWLQAQHLGTLMTYLAEHGCRKTMQQALALGAPAEVVNGKGHTPLDYALFYEYKEIEKMLRAHGATRHTPRPTAAQVHTEEVRKLEERRAQVAAEYQEKLKTLKPGDTPPPISIVVEPLHRPVLE